MKKSVWGWLYPLKDNFEPLVLKKDEYTVGRHSGCSYVIKEEQLDRYDFAKVLEKQFKIVKKKDGVFIEDIGGTYINNKNVGHGLKSRISHNDYISIVQPFVKVFVYVDRAQSEASSFQLPPAIGDKYHISYKLGQGGFGEVSLLFNKETGKRYAMKIVKKTPNIMKYARTEAEILRKIVHPCVIMTEEVVDTQSTLFIAMELMDGGDLHQRVKSKFLSEAQTKLIFYQLVQAIECLHKHNIVHRDIKPQNVLLASRSNETLIKVTDFGVSKILKPGTEMDTYVGTPVYIAPEIEKPRVTAYVYDKKVDVWSMGVLLYECLSFSLPFRSDGPTRNYTVEFPKWKWCSISNDVVSLIKSMLKVQPTLRIGVEQILAHSWLKDERMRRRAHELMWPGKPYVPPAALPAIPQRKLSLPSESNRLQPRGVQQYMSQRLKPVAASPPQLVKANINYQPVRQNVLPPPKPLGSPLEKKYNPSPLLFGNQVRLEEKYNSKPYVYPIVKPNLKPPSSPQDKKPLSPYAQVRPSASPVEKKSPLLPQQRVGGNAFAKLNVSPVERKPFNYPSSGAKEVKPRSFALNKK